MNYKLCVNNDHWNNEWSTGELLVNKIYKITDSFQCSSCGKKHYFFNVKTKGNISKPCCSCGECFDDKEGIRLASEERFRELNSSDRSHVEEFIEQVLVPEELYEEAAELISTVK